MKGFKPMGRGMSQGFRYPANMGFTGSTGGVQQVSGYTRKFATGGFVRQDNPREKVTSGIDPGRATVSRSRPSSNLDQQSGGRSPLRPGYRRGGALSKADGGPVSDKEAEYRRAQQSLRALGLYSEKKPAASTVRDMQRLKGAGQITEKEAQLIRDAARKRQMQEHDVKETLPIRKRGGGKVGTAKRAMKFVKGAMNPGSDPYNTWETKVAKPITKAMKNAQRNPGVDPYNSHPTQAKKWSESARGRAARGKELRHGGGVKKNSC
jgi:hypothetical protein